MRVLSDKLVVKVITETVSEGGIHIPAQATQAILKGEVVKVGPGRTENGQVVEMNVSVGDRVAFNRNAGIEVNNMRIIREPDIIYIDD